MSKTRPAAHRRSPKVSDLNNGYAIRPDINVTLHSAMKQLLHFLSLSLTISCSPSVQKKEVHVEASQTDTLTQVDSSGYSELFTQIDTLKKWIQERPFYGTAGNNFGLEEGLEEQLIRSTQKIDSLFIEVLSNPLSCKIKLEDHFKLTHSPDKMVYVIE